MTIKDDKRREGYVGLGNLDVYTYGFKIFRATDLLIEERIILSESGFSIGDVIPQTVGIVGSGADYEVSGVKNKGGGTVLRTAGDLPTTRFLAIVLSPAFIQDTSIRNQKKGLRGRIEDEFDRSRQIDLSLFDTLQRCLKVGATIDPAVVNMTLPTPASLKFFRWNAAADAIDNVDIAALDAIALPGSPGIAIFLGSNNFTSRILVGTNGITITDDDGVSGNPTISGLNLQNQITSNDNDISGLQTRTGVLEEQLVVSEQSTPDNTVFVTAGQVNDPGDPTAKPTDVAADAASAVTFGPTTGGNSRIDLLVVDRVTGVFTGVTGVDAGSPTVPAYPTDKWVRAEITITDTGTVVINDADIRNIKSYLDYSNIQGQLQEERGTYTTNNTNNRVISTGLPVGSVLIKVVVSNQNDISEWHIGDVAEVFQGLGPAINATNVNRFAISGLNFVVGTLGANGTGIVATGWTVIYKEPS